MGPVPNCMSYAQGASERGQSGEERGAGGGGGGARTDETEATDVREPERGVPLSPVNRESVGEPPNLPVRPAER